MAKLIVVLPIALVFSFSCTLSLKRNTPQPEWADLTWDAVTKAVKEIVKLTFQTQ